MYNTMDVLAVAIAAYQYNGNQYIKDNESYTVSLSWVTPVSTTAPISTISPTEPKKWSSKDMMKAYFGVDHYSADSTRPPFVKVTDEHRAIAQKIKDYVKKDFFKLMSVPDAISYEAQICQLVNQETVNLTDFGYIASTPKYYYNSIRKDYVTNRMESLDSKHVGVVGGKISLERFEVLKKVKSKNFNGHAIHGICDGNLYFYFAGEGGSPLHFEEGDVISLDARVKAHMFEKDKYAMTKLSYVRYRAPSKHEQRDKDNN